EDVSQQNINQSRSTRANLASTPTGLVSQAQPVLLNFQKFFIQRENLGGTPCASGREAAFGVRQNFLQLSRYLHQSGVAEQFRSQIQKPKSVCAVLNRACLLVASAAFVEMDSALHRSAAEQFSILGTP